MNSPSSILSALKQHIVDLSLPKVSGGLPMTITYKEATKKILLTMQFLVSVFILCPETVEKHCYNKLWGDYKGNLRYREDQCTRSF